MQTGIRAFVKTRPTVDFILACVHGAAFDIAAIPIPRALWGRSIIRGVALYQVQDVDWAISLFASAAGVSATLPGDDTFLGQIVLPDTNRRIATAGLYRQYVGGLNIAYQDADAQTAAGGEPNNLHIVLENIDGGQDKAADAAGALRIVFDMEFEAQNG